MRTYGNHTLIFRKDFKNDPKTEPSVLCFLLGSVEDDALVLVVVTSTEPFRSSGLVHPHNAPTISMDKKSMENKFIA